MVRALLVIAASVVGGFVLFGLALLAVAVT